MAGKYSYLLYWYEEHGPEGLQVTCDKSLLADMFRNYPNIWRSNWSEPKPLEVLEELLKLSDEELADKDGKHPLFEGWGSLVLQVVKLQTRESE